MVAKHNQLFQKVLFRLNLAKIHMVAKPTRQATITTNSLNLAKIHMVAKQTTECITQTSSLNLAKIHMVAKLYSTFLQE